jgi:hypothetical protein
VVRLGPIDGARLQHHARRVPRVSACERVGRHAAVPVELLRAGSHVECLLNRGPTGSHVECLLNRGPTRSHVECLLRGLMGERERRRACARRASV